MKILLVGNHSCANRGDAAILRGLLSELSRYPDLSFDIISRYPENARYFLDMAVRPDPFYPAPQLTLISKVFRRLEPLYLTFVFHVLKPNSKWLKRLLPGRFKEHIVSLQRYDAVWHVGGSFFVDLYGYPQYDHLISAIAADKPVFLVAHSVGPFSGILYRRFAQSLFSKVEKIGLREKVSLSELKASGFKLDRVVNAADTAWLVKRTHNEPKSTKQVAITVRDLAGFAGRLGTTQAEYEQKIADITDFLVSLGYAPSFFSTCTGIDGYRYDDRMIALRIKALCRHKEKVHVEMAELNDLELGQRLAECELVLATRLHSAIIAMNFGTVAITLNYEHKSAGIYEQMQLSALSFEE